MDKLLHHIRWENDYHVWADTILQMFRAYGLIDYVEHDFDLRKDATSEDQKNEDLVKLAIRIALPIDAARELNTKMTAFEMWRAVRAYYTREEEASKDAELDRFLKYRMLPSQEMADYLSKRKIGWSKLKSYMPELDECIYHYAIFTGLQDLPDQMYKETINIIQYSSKTTKTELTVSHISAVLMQRAMEIRGDQDKELVADRALQAKTPEKFVGQRPRIQKSQSYAGSGKNNKRLQCLECGSTEHLVRKCPSVTCSKCGKKGHMAGWCHAQAHHVEELAEDLGVALMATDVSSSDCHQIIVDSGASRPFTGNKNILVDYQPTMAVSVKIADGRVYRSVGMGTMCIRTKINGDTLELIVPNTYFIQEFQNTLLSAIDLTDRDHTVIMNKIHCQILAPDGTLAAIAYKENSLFRINVFGNDNAFLSDSSNSALELWHKRLGHVNFQTICDMSSSGFFSDLKIPLEGKVDHCETCIKAKHTRKSLPKESSSYTSLPLELVHSDLCGPFPSSFNGGRYFITFMDDYTRFGKVYVLKSKSDALAAFKKYKGEAETVTGHKIKTLRSDRGGEFLNHLFDAFLTLCGILRQLTNPCTPEQNGIAERLNRTLIEMVTAMLSNSGLPKVFWAEAVSTVMYIRNHVFTRAVK